MSKWWLDPEEYENEYEIVYTGVDFDMVRKDKNKVDEKPKQCHHEWRQDTFFSAKVFETCKKCGLKKEDLK